MTWYVYFSTCRSRCQFQICVCVHTCTCVENNFKKRWKSYLSQLWNAMLSYFNMLTGFAEQVFNNECGVKVVGTNFIVLKSFPVYLPMLTNIWTSSYLSHLFHIRFLCPFSFLFCHLLDSFMWPLLASYLCI